MRRFATELADGKYLEYTIYFQNMGQQQGSSKNDCPDEDFLVDYAEQKDCKLSYENFEGR